MRRRSRAGPSVKPRRQTATPKRPSGTGTARPRHASAVSQESEAARLASELSAMGEILRLISNSPSNVAIVLRAVAEQAAHICQAQNVDIHLIENDNLRVVAWFGELKRTLVFPLDRSSVAGRSVCDMRPISVADLQNADDEFARGREIARRDGICSIVAVPLIREGRALGTIAVYRTEIRPFEQKHIALLTNFAAQAVIAIENARLLNELRESLDRQTATADILRVIAGTPEDSKRALDTIAETASRMFGVANVNFRRIEGDVLRIVSSAGPTTERLRKALPDIPLEPTDPAVRCFLDNRQIPVEDRRAVLANERGAIATALRELPVRSQVFTPLSRQGKAIGVMIVTRSEVQPFQQGDLDLMKGFADQAVIAIENARLLSELRESYRLVQQQAGKLEAQSQELVKLNQQLEQRVADQVGEIERMGRLRRFLPPQVADLIVASGTEKQLESHRREITALFCDLRGFTGFSESSDPEDVIALLREYHAAIGEIIIKYNGTLERFAGDGVMVVFNDPVPVDNPALQAALMALDMRTAIGALIDKWRDLGHDLGFGIGIAHGFATLGTIGFEGRFDYAAIGTVSNVASRLCDEAKPGQILISPRVRLAVEKVVTVEPVGEFTLKGIRRPMMAYNVLSSSPSKLN
jgi:class 3 adenylate cyclase/putative methionine-R-sulfoxide reductase with GAF domain